MCTRILYETGTGTFITGRGMDWNDPNAKTRVFAYPKGLKQTGGPVDNAITWCSKHGSVISSFYDAATADGINERGLVVNNLYLAEADFGDPAKTDKPLLSIGAWAQYFLDNFATPHLNPDKTGQAMDLSPRYFYLLFSRYILIWAICPPKP